MTDSTFATPGLEGGAAAGEPGGDQLVLRYAPDGAVIEASEGLLRAAGVEDRRVAGLAALPLLAACGCRVRLEELEALRPDHPLLDEEVDGPRPDAAGRLRFTHLAHFGAAGEAVSYVSVGRSLGAGSEVGRALHRAANSMAVIASLTALQRARSGSSGVRAELDALERRVRVVALAHDELRRGSAERIQLAPYLAGAVRLAAEARDRSGRNVRVTIEPAPVELEIARAIPCGLIVLELVTNAMQHAFLEGGPGASDAGKVHVTITESGGRVELVVRDDGCGIADDQPSGFGLQLVDLLAHQLGAETRTTSHRGTQTTIAFSS